MNKFDINNCLDDLNYEIIDRGLIKDNNRFCFSLLVIQRINNLIKGSPSLCDDFSCTNIDDNKVVLSIIDLSMKDINCEILQSQFFNKQSFVASKSKEDYDLEYIAEKEIKAVLNDDDFMDDSNKL